MKVIFLALTLTYTYCTDWNIEARNFVSSYIGTINGNPFVLDVDCLSGQFTTILANIDDAIQKKNYTEFITNAFEIINLELSKCPVDTIEQLYNDYQRSYESGLIVKNVLSNLLSIEDSCYEYIEKADRDIKDLGVLLGTLTKIAIYGTNINSFLK
jgi:hypothetical protein